MPQRRITPNIPYRTDRRGQVAKSVEIALDAIGRILRYRNLSQAGERPRLSVLLAVRLGKFVIKYGAETTIAPGWCSNASPRPALFPQEKRTKLENGVNWASSSIQFEQAATEQRTVRV
jgi:hypothetical protein